MFGEAKESRLHTGKQFSYNYLQTATAETLTLFTVGPASPATSTTSATTPATSRHRVSTVPKHTYRLLLLLPVLLLYVFRPRFA